MKSYLISLLITVTILSGALVESSCLCIDDLDAHVTEISHDYSDHKQEKESEEDHCAHICTQCHFVALEAPKLIFESSFQFFQLSFFFPSEEARSITSLLYRPPIS